MPDPFAFFADPSQAALGIAPPAPVATPKPAAPALAAPQPRSTAATMLAPAAPAPPVQPQHPATVGGVDQFMQLVRAHESGGNDKATSGVADGRYQFTPQTWAGVAREHPELGLRPQDIWDGAKQDLAMRAISADYVNVLKMNGLETSMPNMFMLHFLGTGGGPKFLKEMAANPNANAAALFPLEAQYNHNDFFEKTGQPRTLQQVYAAMTKTLGGPAASMAPVNPTELKAIESFDKAAGVSTVPQGFTAQAPPLPPDAVPLPAGATPIKPSLPKGAVPLPPGAAPLKLDYASKTPLTSANPYAEGAKLKDDAKPPEVISVDPITGMPVFADEKLNKAELSAEGEVNKGFAAGVAQDVTGPASMLPNWLGGGYAEKANEALDKTGDPTARTLGQMAPMAIPLGGVVGAAKLGGEALEAGESLIPSMLRGAGSGAGGSAVIASSTPTGKEAYGERLKAKAPAMAESGLIGATLGGVLPGAAAAGRWLGGEAKFLWSAFSGEAKKSAQELLTGFKAETGQALSVDERKIAETKVAEELERVKLEKHDAELKKIADAQAQLAERERVRSAENRDARQVDNPKAAEELRAGVTARARERVRQAEEQAKGAGATEEQAKAYAVEQEQKALDAKTAAQEIAAEFAKNPSTMTRERFGEVVQKAAADMQEKAEEAREKAAGFKEAMQSAPPGPVVKNDRVMKVLDDIDASSADRSVHAITDEIRKQFVTRQRNAEGEWEVVDKSGITVERADSLRKVLNTAMRSRKMAVESGSADASAAQHHIGKVLEDLEDATGAAHPPYNEAVKAWRENSRGPLDQFLPKQALGKITKTEDFSGRFAMNEGRVAAEILSQSNQGSEALATLVKQNPEVMTAAEQYLDRQFQTAVGSKAAPEKVDKFIRNNESTLDKLGLRKKYEDARDTLADAGKDVKGAEASAKAAKTAAKQAEAQRNALEGVAKQRKSVLERSKNEQPGDVFSPGEGQSKANPYAGRSRAVGAESGVDPQKKAFDSIVSERRAAQPAKDPAKSAAEKAKADAARLKEKAAGPEAAKAETQKSIDAIAKEHGKAETSRKAYVDFQSRIEEAEKKGTLSNERAIGECKTFLETLRNRDIIDDAKYKEMYGQMQTAIKANDEQKSARWLILKLGAVLAAVGGAGEYVSHRFTIK